MVQGKINRGRHTDRVAVAIVVVVAAAAADVCVCVCVCVCVGWWSVCLCSSSPRPGRRHLQYQLVSLVCCRHDVTWRHRDTLRRHGTYRLHPVLTRSHLAYLLTYRLFLSLCSNMLPVLWSNTTVRRLWTACAACHTLTCIYDTQVLQITSASAGLQDANPTIRPYATPPPPIPTAHRGTASWWLSHPDHGSANCIFHPWWPWPLTSKMGEDLSA